jgi:hypothetical protein
MDEIVRAAMAKWPNVPNCYGWLGLDSRGQWWMRDDRVQAAGPFAGEGANAASRGVRLEHEKLVAFIERNYGHDTLGCWYFQNGPQRVYVELELAPWVWRLEPSGQMVSHTGQSVEIVRWCVDEFGHLLGQSEQGWGVLHSMDMARWAERNDGKSVQEVRWHDWYAKAGFYLSPQKQKPAEASS